MPPSQTAPFALPILGASLGSMGIANHIEAYVTTHRYTVSSQAIGRKILGRFALETGDPDPDDLTEAHIHRWWRSVSEKAAAASLRAYHSTVRGFLHWLHLPAELMEGIRRPRIGRSAPRPLSPAEVDRLRMSCGNMRDRAMVELGHGIGLRAMEVAGLEVPDIDWSGRRLFIHSKGGNEDDLPLPDRVAWVLHTYFEESPPVPTGFVVRNLYKPTRGLTPAYVTQRVAEISYRAGVKKAPLDGCGMHGLRRGFATDLHNAGVPIKHIQRLMRHERLTSTEAYIADANDGDLLRALQLREDAS